MNAISQIFNSYKEFKKAKLNWVQTLRNYGWHDIILTNGCFDILTLNHIKFLHEFFEQGGIHIILLDSDESIKKIKGSSRPINNFEHRAEMLSEVFNRERPFIIKVDSNEITNIIKKLKPKLYFKGGDYKKETINDYDIIKKNTGWIILTEKFAAQSTTEIIEKIKRHD